MSANGTTKTGLVDRVQDFDPNPYFRKGILVATNQKQVASLVKKYGMRAGASRFVAGESWEECVPVLKRLNAAGLRCNTTLLGEAVTDAAQTEEVVASYKAILDGIAEEHLNCNVALKLTHLGLTIDEELAFRNVETLIEHAASLNNFIRMDMEDSPVVDATLRIYQRLLETGHTNTGTVLQSYLYRTPKDLEQLIPFHPNLRLVKGAYLEPESIAYPRKEDVDKAYLELVDKMLLETSFVAVATHDQKIIDHVVAFTKQHNVGNDRFEFQMLYGIRSQYQKDLAKQGYGVRVATPHGPDWYYYLMRRLAERPANLLFVAKNVVSG